MFNLHSNVRIAMLTVLGLLIIASLARRILEHRHPDRDYTELRQRIHSWWWMVGLLFGVLILNRIVAVAFFGVLSFLAFREFLSIVPVRDADQRVVLWAYAAIPIHYFWVGISWYGMFIVFIPVYLFLFLPMKMVIIGETGGFIKSAGVIHWAVMLTVFSISHIAYLLNLTDPETGAFGVGLVLYLIFLTEFNDVSQYVWGKMKGKRPILPNVSPNKTWEGFLGGVGTTVLFGSALSPFLTPMTFLEGAMAGTIISMGGFIGDVVMSSVKRDLNIKDSGTLIPGHGGILDRLDSLTYTAPLFFHYIYYLHF